jgi:hypothetical protein
LFRLRARVGDVFPTDEPDFYDDLFLMRFVMTHSKGGKECKWQDAEDALRKTITWRKEHAQELRRIHESGKAPHEDICMKFNTVGYAGDLGGLEPIFVVRTGHCNTKGLMNTMTETQVVDCLHLHTHTHSLSLSLSHTHTHTHTYKSRTQGDGLAAFFEGNRVSNLRRANSRDAHDDQEYHHN